eukprot:12686598-Alexandrium_andersonii.AAC.1
MQPNYFDNDEAGVSPQRVGHMVGNSMSVCVLERLLPNVLKSIGVTPSNPRPDPWASLSEAA